jgi:hypothetical protein
MRVFEFNEEDIVHSPSESGESATPRTIVDLDSIVMFKVDTFKPKGQSVTKKGWSVHLSSGGILPVTEAAFARALLAWKPN